MCQVFSGEDMIMDYLSFLADYWTNFVEDRCLLSLYLELRHFGGYFLYYQKGAPAAHPFINCDRKGIEILIYLYLLTTLVFLIVHQCLAQLPKYFAEILNYLLNSFDEVYN